MVFIRWLISISDRSVSRQKDLKEKNGISAVHEDTSLNLSSYHQFCGRPDIEIPENVGQLYLTVFYTLLYKDFFAYFTCMSYIKNSKMNFVMFQVLKFSSYFKTFTVFFFGVMKPVIITLLSIDFMTLLLIVFLINFSCWYIFCLAFFSFNDSKMLFSVSI